MSLKAFCPPLSKQLINKTTNNRGADKREKEQARKGEERVVEGEEEVERRTKR